MEDASESKALLDAAIESAERLLRPSAPYFIWRYPDGRHDWSSDPACEPRNSNTRAVLVLHAHAPGWSSATWSIEHCPLCAGGSDA